MRPKRPPDSHKCNGIPPANESLSYDNIEDSKGCRQSFEKSGGQSRGRGAIVPAGQKRLDAARASSRRRRRELFSPNQSDGNQVARVSKPAVSPVSQPAATTSRDLIHGPPENSETSSRNATDPLPPPRGGGQGVRANTADPRAWFDLWFAARHPHARDVKTAGDFSARTVPRAKACQSSGPFLPSSIAKLMKPGLAGVHKCMAKGKRSQKREVRKPKKEKPKPAPPTSRKA
jgi:hypothetical protein